MKKQKTIDFSRLLPEQINFIKNKIEEQRLGREG